MIQLRVNGERLNASLMELAQIGATPNGGVTRLTLSEEDRAGRDLLHRWMEKAGLEVRVDDFGNMTGLRPGTEPGPPVRLGSHADSQPQGGRYDGALGVLGALEVIRTLNDLDVRTRRPLQMVNWTNEEGARFQPAMLCSGAVIGRFEKEYVYSRTATHGLHFGDELRRIGYLGEEANRPGPAAAYLELHIEQGPALEAAGLAVGVVEGIVGITWIGVRLRGQADHAGPTPMPTRRDALVGASHIVAQVETLARATDRNAVGTVGRLQVEPNVINIIPGEVELGVDFRHPDLNVLDGLAEGLERSVREIAESRRLEASVDRFWTSEPTPFDPAVVDTVQASCDELGLSTIRLWSGAGHDAKYMADVCPTGMIFVRSRGGLSHCEAEYSSPEDIEAGANVLLATTVQLASIASD